MTVSSRTINSQEPQVVPIRSEPLTIKDVLREQGRTLRQDFLTFGTYQSKEVADEQLDASTIPENTTPADPKM